MKMPYIVFCWCLHPLCYFHFWMHFPDKSLSQRQRWSMRPDPSCLHAPHSILSFLWVSAIYMDNFTVQSLCLTWYLIWKNGIDGCAWMLELVSLIWFMTSMLISTTKWSLNAPFDTFLIFTKLISFSSVYGHLTDLWRAAALFGSWRQCSDCI